VWNEILTGLIPNFGQWFHAAPAVSQLIDGTPEAYRDFWQAKIMSSQRDVMISTTATVVGINMTFLLPYSMLNRGWDRPFLGLARFDLITGMAIPFVLVTSCIAIASAHSFHAKADENFLSSDPAQVAQSDLLAGATANLTSRVIKEHGEQAFSSVDEMPTGTKEEVAAQSAARVALLADYVARMSEEERKLAATLVKPDAGKLAQSLAPLLGESNANVVFGLGAFGMGFSTIIILMMINGYAFAELVGRYDSNLAKAVGALVAGIIGACWPAIWQGDSKTWLIIMASTFGAIFLPIAYVSFFALMNSQNLLREYMPRGGRRWLWNILMAFGVVAAFAQAISALSTKVNDPVSGQLVIGGAITFALLAVVGFSARFKGGEDLGS
jgi:Mn2+/Fe2+ NRAMP family transporter